MLDPSDGSVVGEVTRPQTDRLMGWDSDDQLIWWHPDGESPSVVATETAGGGERTLLEVPGAPSTLAASWTEDAP